MSRHKIKGKGKKLRPYKEIFMEGKDELKKCIQIACYYATSWNLEQRTDKFY